MKLAIADPPYLGKAAQMYGPGRGFPAGDLIRGLQGRRIKGDEHPDARVWDDPENHRRLVISLVESYDGWVISMNPENLRHYLKWVPPETRVCAWIRPNAFPAGHIVRSWEPVLLKPPDRGRARNAQVRDSIVANHLANRGRLIGGKPSPWTRWVLDLLGYDPEIDTVDDLFDGSGAVTAEINQQVLL